MDISIDQFTVHRYWVEVLLDDGLMWGCAEDAYTPEQAADFAFNDCEIAGLCPVRIESITNNETGQQHEHATR